VNFLGAKKRNRKNLPSDTRRTECDRTCIHFKFL